jgi:large exoprotein involved in heme utilization and adhesion
VSLFLLNPNGILFGANARLEISGSFVGTTVNSIKFADGISFGTQNPTPLLTMSVPICLQMVEVLATGTVEFIGSTPNPTLTNGTVRSGIMVMEGN